MCFFDCLQRTFNGVIIFFPRIETAVTWSYHRLSHYFSRWPSSFNFTLNCFPKVITQWPSTPLQWHFMSFLRRRLLPLVIACRVFFLFFFGRRKEKLISPSIFRWKPSKLQQQVCHVPVSAHRIGYFSRNSSHRSFTPLTETCRASG